MITISSKKWSQMKFLWSPNQLTSLHIPPPKSSLQHCCEVVRVGYNTDGMGRMPAILTLPSQTIILVDTSHQIWRRCQFPSLLLAGCQQTRTLIGFNKSCGDLKFLLHFFYNHRQPAASLLSEMIIGFLVLKMLLKNHTKLPSASTINP